MLILFFYNLKKTVVIKEKLHKQLKVLSVLKGKSLQDLVNSILSEYLQKEFGQFSENKSKINDKLEKDKNKRGVKKC